MLQAMFVVSAGPARAPQLIDAQTFFALTDVGYQASAERGPWCPECKRLVHGYGRSSFNVRPRFDHFEAATDCVLSKTSVKEPQDRDVVALARHQREEYFKPEHFENGFRLLLSIFARDSGATLTPREYGNLLLVADRDGLWKQVRLFPWKVPFALATYRDAQRSQRGYLYRFVLAAQDDGEHTLFKCFADSVDRGQTKFVTNPKTRQAVGFAVTLEDFSRMVAPMTLDRFTLTGLQNVRERLSMPADSAASVADVTALKKPSTPPVSAP